MMQNQDDPLYIVFQMYAARVPIRMLNTYKGVPVSNDGMVTAFESNSSTILITTNRYQFVCLYLSRDTMLYSAALGVWIHAQVVQLNPTTLEARLGGFSFVRRGSVDRKQMRVDTSPTLPCQLQPRNLTNWIDAEVIDLSQSGVGIYLSRHMFMPEVYKAGSELKFQLMLPEGLGPLINNPNPVANTLVSRYNRDQIWGDPIGSTGKGASDRRGGRDAGGGGTASGLSKIALRAVVANVRPEIMYHRYRIGLRIFPNVADQAVITSYISQRQTDLIREVRDSFAIIFKQQSS